MKQVMKRWDTYVYGLILFVVGLTPFFIQMFIYLSPQPHQNFEQYPFVIWIIIACYFLLGIIIPDVVIILYRRKIKDWDSPLPDNIKMINWRIKLPIFTGTALLFLFAITIELILRITNACGGIGHYPFL